MEVSGRLFSGMGKGSYYVGHPEYQKRFERALGYAPYPGTLNIKLEESGVIDGLKALRSAEGRRIDSFTQDGESFSALNCFDGELRGEKVALLFIEVTYYNETVAELISPTYLRGKFGLKDGDGVTFTVNVPGAIRPRQ